MLDVEDPELAEALRLSLQEAQVRAGRGAGRGGAGRGGVGATTGGSSVGRAALAPSSERGAVGWAGKRS